MALTVGTRVRITLSGEVPPPTTGNEFGGFGSGNATRNKVGKLTMFAKTFIILDNKFFIPMTSVIQIEVLPPDQQQTQQGFSSFGNSTAMGFLVHQIQKQINRSQYNSHIQNICEFKQLLFPISYFIS